MSRQSRRRHKPSFKAEVALAALRGDRTLQDLARQHKIHPTVIAQWRKQLLEGAGSLFERGAPKKEEKVVPPFGHQGHKRTPSGLTPGPRALRPTTRP